MINRLTQDGLWLTRSPGRMMAANCTRDEGDDHMPTYRMVYGDGEQVTRETFTDVEVEREDGWVVLFAARKRSCAGGRSTCNHSTC